MTTTQQQQHQPLNTHLIPGPPGRCPEGVLPRSRAGCLVPELRERGQPGGNRGPGPQHAGPAQYVPPAGPHHSPPPPGPPGPEPLPLRGPSYIGSELEHACEAAVEQVTGDLTQEERAALDELALLAIRDGESRTGARHPGAGTHTPGSSHPGRHLRLQGGSPGEDGNIPDWDDLPTEDRLRLVEACRADLINTISEKIGREIQA